MAYGDSDLDPLDPFSTASGPALELDLPAPELRRLEKARKPSPQPAGAKRAKKPEPPREEQGTPARAIELAAHGSPPSFFLEAPYAIAVLRRTRALRQKIPGLRRVRDASELDLAVATLALGRALFAERAHERASELGTALRIANARHRAAAGASEELALAEAEAREKTEALEALIAADAAAARPLRIRARELQAQVVVFQQDFEAVSKVIHEAKTELAVIAKAKHDDVNRRIELEALVTNRRIEADAAVAQIDSRTPELGEITKRIAELERSTAGAQRELDDIRASVKDAKARVGLEGADTLAAFEDALRELADEAVRLRLDHVITPTAARLARLRYDTFFAHHREHEMHELALTLRYEGALKRGIAQLVLLGCALVGWLAYVIVA